MSLEVHTHNVNVGAANALIDNEKDTYNSIFTNTIIYSLWCSINLHEAHFVFDLGCAARINAVHLRNSYNRGLNNRHPKNNT